MTVVITGWRSKIAEEFRALLPTNEPAVWGKPLEENFPVNVERYLFCQGLLRPKRTEDQTQDEIREGYEVNYASIVRRCNQIFAQVPHARVCIIGSESAYRGSFDGIYHQAKAMVHSYVEKKELSQFQQLVAISPGIIADCTMTTSRKDIDNLQRRRDEHPKKRFLFAQEVAALAKTLLYMNFTTYISGTVIRVHGGQKVKHTT